MTSLPPVITHSTWAGQSLPQSLPTYPSVSMITHSGLIFCSFKYSDTQLGLVPPPPFGWVELTMLATSCSEYSSCPATRPSQYSKSTFSGLTSSAMPLTSDKNSASSLPPTDPDVSTPTTRWPTFSPIMLGIYVPVLRNLRLTLRQLDVSLALQVALTNSRNTSRQSTLGSSNCSSSRFARPVPLPATFSCAIKP